MVLDGAAWDDALHGEVTDPRSYLARFGYEAPEIAETACVRPLDVEVNHGTWIWRCPCAVSAEGGLPSGGIAFITQPIGWCPRCENAGADGLWRPLRFPVEREQIEAQLSRRPDRATRNWWPGETIEDLARENAEHGVAP